MTQFPVEHDDGMADVAQFIIGHSPLKFVIQFFAPFSFDGKFTEIANMAADAMGDVVECHAKQQCQYNGKVDVGVVGL